jgi:hypothetical protein
MERQMDRRASVTLSALVSVHVACQACLIRSYETT